MKQVVMALCAMWFALPTLAQPLADRLDKLLADTLLNDSEVGLAVYDLTADTLLFDHQAEKLYRPASIQKIMTAVTALEFLGIEHSLNTTLYYTGRITPDSLLEGDLYVIGGFDPMFGKADMDNFAAAVRAAGIRNIDGGIIGNRTLKDTLKWGSGWCWDDGMPLLTPLLCERTDSFIPMFRQALVAQGIMLADTLGSYVEEAPDSVLTLVAESRRRLPEVMDRMMKKSDNLHAEALFYHLAAMGSEKQHYASADDGAKMIHKMIRRVGHQPGRFLMADGSGVSLYNYLSPAMLVDVLIYAYKHKHIYRPLYESLPVAGIDGTLKNRMKKTPAYRKVRAKTGTVTGVCSLAGYARNEAGHLLAFVIINQNMLRARATRAWQDNVCAELCK